MNYTKIFYCFLLLSTSTLNTKEKPRKDTTQAEAEQIIFDGRSIMKETKHGGQRENAGRPKITEPRNIRKMLSWTAREWELVEKFGGKDLANFQRDAILDRCR